VWGTDSIGRACLGLPANPPRRNVPGRHGLTLSEPFCYRIFRVSGRRASHPDPRNRVTARTAPGWKPPGVVPRTLRQSRRSDFGHSRSRPPLWSPDDVNAGGPFPVRRRALGVSENPSALSIRRKGTSLSAPTAWKHPTYCNQCPHSISAHVLWEPDGSDAGWMRCTVPGCTTCWHHWPRLDRPEPAGD
jgi:hypothetical protein